MNESFNLIYPTEKISDDVEVCKISSVNIKPTTSCYLTRLSDKAVIPKLGSDNAAAYDLYACLDEDVIIGPQECEVIGTGWSIQPPNGFCAYIMARSGLATKQGLRPANCVGLCDWDYRGEYKVALYNDSKGFRTIHNGDRIAQLMFVPYFQVEFEETDRLSETERGDGGFGHTGISG